MNWKSILGAVAPVLSGVLDATGPVGMLGAAAITAVSNAVLGKPDGSADEVQQAIQKGLPPEAVVALQKADNDFKVQMAQVALQKEQAEIGERTAQVQATSASAAAVNESMQTEDKADHWPTYSWRPFIGGVFGLNLLLSSLMVVGVFAAQVCGATGAPLVMAQLPQVLGMLATINGLALPILGVASYFRGKAQADPNIATDNRG